LHDLIELLLLLIQLLQLAFNFSDLLLGDGLPTRHLLDEVSMGSLAPDSFDLVFQLVSKSFGQNESRIALFKQRFVPLRRLIQVLLLLELR
jgi:hypothetical protein